MPYNAQVYDNRRRTNRKKAMGKFQQLVNAIRRVEVKSAKAGRAQGTSKTLRTLLSQKVSAFRKAIRIIEKETIPSIET